MKTQNKTSVAVLAALGLTLGATSFSAQAIQAGDMFARVTATTVNPTNNQEAFSIVPAIAKVDSNTQLGATFVYMIKNNVGIEILAATPFSHEISAGGSKIGETKQLPPTVSIQYYFNAETKLRPYVGVGLNYTTFFNDKTISGLGGDLELDDSFGLAAQIGADYDINEKWFISADVRYINIETKATNSVAGTADVEINPTVVSIGVGYKF